MSVWFFYGCLVLFLWVVFIFLAASGLSCDSQDLSLHRGLFVSAHRFLSSCGMRVFSFLLRRASSVVVARGLSCTAACGISVPRPGVDTMSPALEGRFLTTGPPGKSLLSCFLYLSFYLELTPV